MQYLLGRFDDLSLLALVPVVLALELLDAAGGVHVLHLARKERMACRANLDGDVLARAARIELVAAATGYRGLDVLRVNAFFHSVLLGRTTFRNQETLL